MKLWKRWKETKTRLARSAHGARSAALLAAMFLCVATWAARADVPPAVLAQARHDLAVSEQVLVRLTGRLELASASPATRPEERQRLDEYLVRVRALVAMNRERVRDLERQVADRPAGTVGSPEEAKPVAAVTEAEQVAMLDARLGDSLAAFDKLLLDEARKARTRDAESSATHGGSGGAGSGSGMGSSKSRDAKSGESGESGEPGDSGQGTGKSQHPGTEAGARGGPKGAPQDGAPGGPIGGRDRGASGTDSATAPPPDVGNGNDDDIVARQIRKAAEAESDPELRKKLWDEYRKYKLGTSRGASSGASG